MHRVSNLPVVFSSYIDENNNGPCKLEILQPFDSRCSTFLNTTPPMSMAKVSFLPYGIEVHRALSARGLAPTLFGYSQMLAIGADIVVMEYLAPPTAEQSGWSTLHDFYSD